MNLIQAEQIKKDLDSLSSDRIKMMAALYMGSYEYWTTRQSRIIQQKKFKDGMEKISTQVAGIVAADAGGFLGGYIQSGGSVAWGAVWAAASSVAFAVAYNPADDDPIGGSGGGGGGAGSSPR